MVFPARDVKRPFLKRGFRRYFGCLSSKVTCLKQKLLLADAVHLHTTPPFSATAIDDRSHTNSILLWRFFATKTQLFFLSHFPSITASDRIYTFPSTFYFLGGIYFHLQKMWSPLSFFFLAINLKRPNSLHFSISINFFFSTSANLLPYCQFSLVLSTFSIKFLTWLACERNLLYIFFLYFLYS